MEEAYTTLHNITSFTEPSDGEVRQVRFLQRPSNSISLACPSILGGYLITYVSDLIDGAGEYAEDGHHVEEVSTAIVPRERDAFPKEGGHVVVDVPVVQVEERGEKESTPLLAIVVPHAPRANANLVHFGPVPSKASPSDIWLEIGKQVTDNDAKRCRIGAIPARKCIHQLKC